MEVDKKVSWWILNGTCENAVLMCQNLPVGLWIV